MKKCELCTFPARAYCESDQASLCWGCDAKVHRANFLAARHTRSLLCHTCQSLTPWTASGCKLGRTVSVCESCMTHPRDYGRRREDEEDQGHEGDTDSTSGGDGSDDGVEDDEDQVVPCRSSTTPPPPACMTSSTSSSSEKGYHGEFGGGAVSFANLRKVRRHSSGTVSSFQVDNDHISSQEGREDNDDGEVGGSSPVDSCCSRRLKKQRVGRRGQSGPPEPVV